jgi:hypothetical protein
MLTLFFFILWFIFELVNHINDIEHYYDLGYFITNDEIDKYHHFPTPKDITPEEIEKRGFKETGEYDFEGKFKMHLLGYLGYIGIYLNKLQKNKAQIYTIMVYFLIIIGTTLAVMIIYSSHVWIVAGSKSPWIVAANFSLLIGVYIIFVIVILLRMFRPKTLPWGVFFYEIIINVTLFVYFVITVSLFLAAGVQQKGVAIYI